MQNYQVLARKYRPQNFSDVVGQDTIVTTLKNALRFKKIAHAYLFSGSRGTGKTTLARLFAKSLNCNNLKENQEPCNGCPSCLEIMNGQSLDVIEIDGASNRGIDDIREINEMVGYVPARGNYKIYIIDEVHMLTKEAFNALLKTLEEPPATAKFFFATTEPQKVLPTIISRCQRFDLGRISTSGIIKKLEEIAQDLSRDVEQEALFKIADMADGSLRDAESLFDQVLCFTEREVSAKNVQEIFGLVSHDHFFELDTAFSELKHSFAFELIDHLFQSGKDLNHFMSQLIDHYRYIALGKTIGETALPEAIASRYIQASKHYTKQQSLYILEYLINAQTNLQKSLSPRIFLETTLLHIIRSKNRVPVEVIARRLSELEGKKMEEPPKALINEAPPQPQVSPTQPEPTALEPPKTPQDVSPQQFQEPQRELEPTALEPPKTPQDVSPQQFQEPQEQPETTLAVPPQTNMVREPSQLKESSLAKESKVIFEHPVSTTDEKTLGQEKEPKAPHPEKKQEPQMQDISLSDPSEDTCKHQSHYDTLLRFAAIELEGSLKS